MPGSKGRPKSLILDLYGAYIRRLGGWMAVSNLITLMGQLGVDEQAVRSAVSRMTRRGLLVQETLAGVRGYRLSDEALRVVTEGDRRIFSTIQPARLEDGWIVVAFSVPEDERDRRHVLRSRLTWMGFGMVANGVWMAPRRMLPELRDTVRRLEFERYVHVFDGTYGGFEELERLVCRPSCCPPAGRAAPPPTSSSSCASGWSCWPSATSRASPHPAHRSAGWPPTWRRLAYHRAHAPTGGEMVMETDVRKLHQRAIESFGARVHAIRDGQWDARTPCEEWDVRTLVNHLVSENRWMPPLLAGVAIAEVGDRFESDLPGDDGKAAWDESAAEAVAAVNDQGAMERIVHLSFGDFPGQEYTMQVFSDLVVHGWD